MSPLARLACWGIGVYQRLGGGEGLWIECNFSPSCSEYAREAIERHGAIVGLQLGADRIQRCRHRQQLGTVEDPVPQVSSEGNRMNLSELVEQEGERIRLTVRELPVELKEEYFRRYQSALRDPDTYAVLSFVLMLGLRHMYLGRWLRGLADLTGTILGVGLLAAGSWVGLVPLVVVGGLDLFALFRSENIVKAHNHRIAQELLRELKP